MRLAKQRQKPTSTRQAITLKGSTKLVTEFFKYSANTYVSSDPSIVDVPLSHSPLGSSSNVVYIHQMTSRWSRNTVRLY
jgi:hypothetical protein